MFDVSAQGPVIVFRGTADQVVIDERFADHMGGNDLQLYIQLFRDRNVKNIKIPVDLSCVSAYIKGTQERNTPLLKLKYRIVTAS